METNRLFYKKSQCQIEAKDYLEWAYSMLENKYTSSALNILAFLEEPINIFEVEQLFQRAVAELKLDEPTYKKQVNAQLQYLLQQIITDKESAIDNAYELYKIYRDNLGYDEHKTLAWLLITDMVDDFKHGDNKNNYTHELIKQSIVQTATEQLI
ncbi:hypothetical protein [Solibacillus isronensis]|uniref:hypothetical protein n=1 Tax=Solibacillus isronensis TaxID=412383 RepID=UPI0009A8AC22|nr:hypothetical protein [Solibacillus isronensis]